MTSLVRSALSRISFYYRQTTRQLKFAPTISINSNQQLRLVHTPRARPKPRAKSQALQEDEHFQEEEYLPPIVFLEAADSAGALSIAPDAALSFLRQYLSLARKPEPGWEKRLCTDNNVTPQTLTMLSMILSRLPQHPRKVLASHLMTSASSLGDPTATNYILLSALRNGDLNHSKYLTPLAHLHFFAKKQGRVDSMVVLGRVLEFQNKEDEALNMFRQASLAETAKSAVALGQDHGLPRVTEHWHDAKSSALVALGHILQRRRNLDGAKEAFTKAALELDNPEAYYFLAMLPDSIDNSSKEVYLLKAASSGVLLACHELALLQLAKAEAVRDDPKSTKDPHAHMAMAYEWFSVGANGGVGQSMIEIAYLCREKGDYDKGLEWLERASRVPEVAAEAELARRDWVQ